MAALSQVDVVEEDAADLQFPKGNFGILFFTVIHFVSHVFLVLQNSRMRKRSWFRKCICYSLTAKHKTKRPRRNKSCLKFLWKRSPTPITSGSSEIEKLFNLLDCNYRYHMTRLFFISLLGFFVFKASRFSLWEGSENLSCTDPTNFFSIQI